MYECGILISEGIVFVLGPVKVERYSSEVFMYVTFCYSCSDGGSTSASASSPSLSDLLTEHIACNINVADDSTSRQHIPLRRKEVWKDTLRCMRKPTFEFSGGLNVKFGNKLEEAIDEGGSTCDC